MTSTSIFGIGYDATGSSYKRYLKVNDNGTITVNPAVSVSAGSITIGSVSLLTSTANIGSVYVQKIEGGTVTVSGSVFNAGGTVTGSYYLAGGAQIIGSTQLLPGLAVIGSTYNNGGVIATVSSLTSGSVQLQASAAVIGSVFNTGGTIATVSSLTAGSVQLQTGANVVGSVYNNGGTVGLVAGTAIVGSAFVHNTVTVTGSTNIVYPNAGSVYTYADAFGGAAAWIGGISNIIDYQMTTFFGSTGSVMILVRTK